jgi:putative membrane protein
MKHLLQKILLNLLAIVGVSLVAPGLSYQNDIKTLFLAALVLSFINAFLRPILKIILLPINILTLGVLGWFINVIILYLTTLIVPGFTISGFTLTLFGSTFILSTFLAYIVISFFLSLFSTLISWIIK